MRLRIDELAQRAGVTSRNIRAYQQRGLLPPPELEGRTGYYGEEHLRRLELIGELQERGYSLEAIRHTLDAWSSGGDLGHLLGFRHLLTAPFAEEEPRRYGLDDLVERFPEAADDPALVERAVQLGLLEPDADGFVARSPLLIEAGAELARAGVPLRAIFDLVVAVRADLADIARRFVGIVEEHVVRPFEAAGGDGDPGEVIETVQRLRPIALEVVRPFLAEQMQRAVEETLREVGLRLDRDLEPPASA